MANLGTKSGVFVARFRYAGKEYKKSLRTRKRADAEAALHAVERALHGLATGLIEVPAGIDPGDFIVSGGTLRTPLRPRVRAPSLAALVDEYLAGQAHKAPSTAYTEGVHLRNLRRALGDRADGPADRLSHRDLDAFLQARLAERSPATVAKERATVVQFFRWAVEHGYLEASLAAALRPVRGPAERGAFRTASEIEAMLARGGLGPAEVAAAWDCLYLTPEEIARLLGTVRERAESRVGFLLHAIPAYTGMRRGEVLRLRWSDVEFAHGYVVARSRKQSRRAAETTRRIDLHAELRSELVAWERVRTRGQYVLAMPEGDDPLGPDHANRAFWQPLRGTAWCLSGAKNWFKVGFHTYRHSFASNLAARGVDQRIIDEWMGHQTEAMRKRYRHLFPKQRREAIESFSFRDTGAS